MLESLYCQSKYRQLRSFPTAHEAQHEQFIPKLQI